MRRLVCLILLAGTQAAVAQSSDSQLLQQILEEIRQLRQEIRGTTLVAQRVQILLYRVQLQNDGTKKAHDHHEQLRARLNEAERRHADAVNGLKEAQEKLDSSQNSAERSALEELVRELKRRAEMAAQDESAAREAEISGSIDLKTEQAKLAEFQQKLETLELQIESYAASSPPN